MCLTLFLSTLIIATDSWFHFTAKTVEFSQVSPVPQSLNTGFRLSPRCANSTSPFGNGTWNGSGNNNCILNTNEFGTFLQGNLTISAQQTINNSSTTTSVSEFQSGSQKYMYLQNP